MGRINVCRACSNISSGVKTRIRVEHTCGKSEEQLIKIRKEASARFKERLEELQKLEERMYVRKVITEKTKKHTVKRK